MHTAVYTLNRNSVEYVHTIQNSHRREIRKAAAKRNLVYGDNGDGGWVVTIDK